MNPYESFKGLKIAIIHDDFIQHGGAEKVAKALLELFPQSDVYTSICTNNWEQELKSVSPNVQIHTSFLNFLPFKDSVYKLLALFYPIVFLLFNLKNYDLVISSTSRFAHGVRTKDKALHLAYVHSPARMVWEPHKYFSLPTLMVSYPILIILRMLDGIVSKFPDRLIANSNVTKERIKKYWNRDSEVINPFYEFKDPNHSIIKPKDKRTHYIIVSRLEKWKKIDIAIKACEELKQKLVIVGEGKHKNKLEKISDSNYVEFTGRLPEKDLVNTYLASKALILTQNEDFGITAIEAQSLGIPVVAYKSGGATETVVENTTGIFFEAQNKESLKDSLRRFEQIVFDPQKCIIQAGKFTKDQFSRKLLDILKHEQ